MKLLLDTHILLWTLANDRRLSPRARLLIDNPGNDVFYSIVSPWEVQIKHQLHPDRLEIGSEKLEEYCTASGFHRLPVQVEHIHALGSLERQPNAAPHRDPFDRMMICQASVEGMLFLTHDTRLTEYTDPCIMRV